MTSQSRAVLARVQHLFLLKSELTTLIRALQTHTMPQGWGDGVNVGFDVVSASVWAIQSMNSTTKEISTITFGQFVNKKEVISTLSGTQHSQICSLEI